MSYNTDKYHQSYPPNNIANSYPPPPPGPPPPIAQTIYQPPPPPQGPPAYQHESLMQENHEHKKDREEDDEPEHWLTMILKMKFLRILTRFIDQGSPLMVYSLMKIWASNIIALVIAMVPPILRIIYFLIVYKHIDPCGVLYLAAFVIAACLTPIPTDAKNKFILESSIVVIMGGMFIISLIPIHFGKFRNLPLIYLNSKKMFEKAEYVRWKDPSTGEKQKMEVHEWAYTYYPTFKKTCVAFTGIYGLLFILVFVARVVMVNSTLSVSDLAENSMIISLCVNIGVGIVILFFVRILINRVETISIEWKMQNGYQ